MEHFLGQVRRLWRYLALGKGSEHGKAATSIYVALALHFLASLFLYFPALISHVTVSDAAAIYSL
jgi:hypothetical protein